jgi:hypothetical protein
MNTKSIILAGAIGLGCASLACAATQYVYMSGSTAARNAFYLTIMDGATVFDATRPRPPTTSFMALLPGRTLSSKHIGPVPKAGSPT